MTFDNKNYDIDNVICIAIAILCIALAGFVIAVSLADGNILSENSIAALCGEALVFAAVSTIGIKFSGKTA